MIAVSNFLFPLLLYKPNIYPITLMMAAGLGVASPRNQDSLAAPLAGKEVDVVVIPPSPRAVTGPSRGCDKLAESMFGFSSPMW